MKWTLKNEKEISGGEWEKGFHRRKKSCAMWECGAERKTGILVWLEFRCHFGKVVLEG